MKKNIVKAILEMDDRGFTPAVDSILVRRGPEIALADDAAALRDQSSEWAAAGRDISERQRNGAPHQRCGRFIVLAQVASSTDKSSQLESFANVSARINVPLAISSGEAYSSGRWL